MNNTNIPPEYDFGIRLKNLRLQRHMTQKQVADYLGVHKNTISNYENNVLTPSVEALTNLALFFNVSTDYILGLDKRVMLAIDDCPIQHQKIIINLVNTLKEDLKNLK